MSVVKDACAFALIILFIQTSVVQSQEPDVSAQGVTVSPVTNLGDPHWVKFNPQTHALPPDAIIGGYENEDLYIIRAKHKGLLRPGKYVPSTQEAIVSWGVGKHVKKDFEILVGYNYIWVPTTTDNIPEGSVIGGYIAKTNEPIYVGRAKYLEHVIPGKIAKSQGVIYLPYNDREVKVTNFEILVVAEKKKPKVAGTATVTVTNGQSVNIECEIIEGVPPPKMSWQFKATDNSNFASIPGSENVLRIAKVDQKDAGVYKCVANNDVGRDEHLTSLTIKSNMDNPHWIPFNHYDMLPYDAIIGGYEHENLYIIRAPHEGSLTPGKYVPSRRQAIISWGGRSHIKNSFEILCGSHYKWVATTTDDIPTRSIVGGYIENSREPLYVGRASFEGQFIPGKVTVSHRVCFVALGDNEVTARNFEILVGTEKTRPTQATQTTTGDRVGTEPNVAPNPELDSLTPEECKPTVTKLRDGTACSGQTLFEDNFNTFREDIWQIEQYIPTSSTDFPFVSYQKLSEDPTVSVTDGNLRISPKLQQNLPGFSEDFIYSGCLDLFNGCTLSGDACMKQAWGASIIPPIVSGKITSRGFAFTYGTVYVRAKFPQGDWLYPEILLEPFLNKYGGTLHNSGIIKIAAARGNKELSLGVRDYSNKALYGGPVMDFQCHDFLLSSTAAPDGRQWGDDFHEYAIRWEPERIILSVDGVEWTRVEPATNGLVGRFPPTCKQIPRKQLESGSKMAPFDDHSYLTLGVSAGSITEFPDNVQTTGWRPKPWSNPSSKALLNFWKDMDAWLETWNQPQLLVDYVKVVAL